MSQHDSEAATTATSQRQRPSAYFSRRHVGVRAVFLIVFAVVVASIALVGESLGRSAGTSSGPTITVSGSGSVTGTPNTLSFQIGAQTVAPSAGAALRENNLEVRKLEASLLGHGVTRQNIQTSGLNIFPTTNQSGAITGFSVSNTLNVTTHQLHAAGAILDAAANAVGNHVQLNGVTFSISNQSKLLAAARTRAIRNARTEAVQIARGAGTSVGAVVSITDEESAGPTGVIVAAPYFLTRGTASIPLEAGSQSVRVRVKVIYRLAS
ncbi:MAG: SIMPL domain-containing protein [Acidimicrobiales bacterium]